MHDARIAAYCRSGRRRVGGWFSRIDAQVFALILAGQDREGGAVVEIGVHHGKSFVPLALSNGGERAYAIDLFDRQEENLDGSGRGNRARFEETLRRHGIAPEGITIDSRRSDEVTPDDILDSVGPVRFFHVDGGHNVEAVQADLRLADATLAPHGVVAVDDAFRPDWPEVDRGMFGLLQTGTLDLVPFAFGQNKLFLCRAESVGRHARRLAGDPLLALQFVKRYRGNSERLSVFRRRADPERPLGQAIAIMLLERYPDAALALARRLRPSFVEARVARSLAAVEKD